MISVVPAKCLAPITHAAAQAGFMSLTVALVCTFRATHWVTGKDKLRPAGSTSPFCPQALELDSIRSHHWRIQGCSAVTGEDLLPGIDWLLDDISSRVFTAD